MLKHFIGREMSRGIVIALLMLPLMVIDLPAQDVRRSSGMLIGSLSGGIGSGGVLGLQKNQSLNEKVTYATDVQIGYVINDYMYFSIDAATIQQLDLATTETEVTYSNWSMGITYFPVGIAYLRFGPSIEAIETSERMDLKDEPGFGFMAGGGVEIILGPVKNWGYLSAIGGFQYYMHSFRGYYTQSNILTVGMLFAIDTKKL